MKHQLFVPAFVIGICMFSAVPALSQNQKQENGPNSVTERFSGELGGPAFAGRPVKVNMAIYHFSNRQNIEAIQRPFSGVMIVQLRGGPVTTVIDGEKKVRHEGEFWTVAAHQKMGIITENDAGVIQIFFISEDSTASMKLIAKKYNRTDSIAPAKYTRLSDGVMERTSYVSDGASAYTVELRDMIVGPGTTTNKLYFEDPAVIEIRSGSGRLIQNGKLVAIKTGSTAMVNQGESIQLDTHESKQRITLRISIIKH